MEKSRVTAYASFVFSLTFWIPLLNLIFGIVAVYLGIKAIGKIKKEPEKYAGKWFAITGIILGALPIVLYAVGLTMCLLGYKVICKNIGLAFLD